MEESRVRYSKLSMMTATKRFSICGNPRGQDGAGESETHPNTFTQRSRGREGGRRDGERETEKEKGDRDREEWHMLTQGAQTERWRNGDVGGRQRKAETGSWRERGERLCEMVAKSKGTAITLNPPIPGLQRGPSEGPTWARTLCSQPQHKASTQQIQAGAKVLTVVSI